MSARLCPRLVRPEYLIPLLVRPVYVLLCPIESLFPILLGKRRFPSCNSSSKAFSFECCTYCFLAALKTKDCRDLNPRRFAILLGGCNLLNKLLSLRSIKKDFPAGFAFLRSKTVGKYVADLFVRKPSLKADLIAGIIGVEEKGLNS